MDARKDTRYLLLFKDVLYKFNKIFLLYLIGNCITLGKLLNLLMPHQQNEYSYYWASMQIHGKSLEHYLLHSKYSINVSN